MPSDNRAPFFVGKWLVQPLQNRIGESDRSVRIEPKVMDVLLRLAESPGQVVTRDELHESVWAGTIVSDDVLSRSVSELRKVFGDDARNPHFIETIPKSGYRLLARVQHHYQGDNLPPGAPVLELAESRIESANTGSIMTIAVGALGATTLLVLAFALLSGSNRKSTFHPSPVTSLTGVEGSPRLSPTAGFVAFHWAGNDANNLDIYIKDLNGNEPVRITTSPGRDHSPAWAPDGKMLAYMSRTETDCVVKSVSIISGDHKNVTTCEDNIYGDLTWSPDGASLLFNRKDNPAGAYSVHMVSIESGERKSITSPPATIWGDHDAAISPSGNKVAFVRSISEGMQDVFVRNLLDSTTTRLTNDSKNISGITWSSDGESVILSSNRLGRFGLWRVDIASGRMTWAGIGDSEAFDPHISGEQLIYRNGTSRTNIVKHDVAADTSAVLIESTRWDMHPALAPDKKSVAFTSNRTGNYEIWLSSIDENRQTQLTHFEGPFTSNPQWSPDGQRLIFASRKDGQSDIFVLNIESLLTPQPLLESPTSNELSASWSTDGSRVYFASDRSGSWEIWSRSMIGGDPVQVTTNGGFGPQESADGDFVFHAKYHEPGLWRTAIEDQTSVLVVPDVDHRDWGSWKVLGDTLVFIDRGNPDAIVKRNLNTGHTDTLLVPNGYIPLMDPAIDVSGDLSTLLYGQASATESDIMIVWSFE